MVNKMIQKHEGKQQGMIVENIISKYSNIWKATKERYNVLFEIHFK